MTYAWRSTASTDWIEVSAEVVLPGFGDDGDARVNPAFAESLSPEDRAVFGLVEVVETDRPTGVRVLGSTVEDVAGVPTRAWVTEAFDTDALAAQRAAVVQRVADEAGRRISAILPDWRQLWIMATVLDRITAHGADPANWPSQDQAAMTGIRASWAAIQEIGAAALAIEAAIPNDAAGIAAFDVAANAAWPA